MFIVTRIHNMSLGSVVRAESFEEAYKVAVDIATSTLKRPLTEYESKELQNDYEIYVEVDPDNQYTFAIGTVEDA